MWAMLKLNRRLMGNECDGAAWTHRLHVRRWDEATLTIRITLWLNFPPAIYGQLRIKRGTRARTRRQFSRGAKVADPP